MASGGHQHQRGLHCGERPQHGKSSSAFGSDPFILSQNWVSFGESHFSEQYYRARIIIATLEPLASQWVLAKVQFHSVVHYESLASLTES